MKVLITGGSGFIGRVTAAVGISKNIDIVTLDAEEGSLIKADISEVNWNDFDLSVFDAVIHLAAMISVPESFEIPDRYDEVNVNATDRLFSACAHQGVSRVIFASSAAVYGSSTEEKKIVGQEFPIESPYAETKVKGEELAKKFSNNETKITVFRFFNVYGPGQEADSPYASVIPKFVKMACSGTPITIEGDGLQTRDFVHVSDVAKTLVNSVLITPSRNFEIINLGTGNMATILDLAGMSIEKARLIGFQKESRVIHVDSREGDVRDSVADLRGLRNYIDHATFLSLEEGIHDLVRDEMHRKNENYST